MQPFDLILEQLDYDLWANLAWLSYLREKGFPEPDAAIFRHIVGSQWRWLNRSKGMAPTNDDVSIDEPDLRNLNAQWKHLLTDRGEDPVMPYERPSGEVVRLRASQMARHILNHAVYHRGELRGLCRARNDSTFPETDLTKFFAEKGLNP